MDGRNACHDGGCRRGKMTYYLALGSNLGDKRRNLERARRRLERAGVEVRRSSSVYRTDPVDFVDQPWFLNQALEVRTDRTPQELLELAKAIEAGLGRVPAETKGPRTIDVDLLLAGETVIESPELTVPHPRLARRNFVLVPLAEIAPRAVHPVLRKTVRELARECPDRSAVVREGARASRRS
ncbi:MAG TPA: 2-amino-4-hydroxy-6-hydroxymethyldihydropteridine diphosphokinase [Terriglobales bacterium]|nr:2-amino-4-hydroxy-6-hydroxymethyldihydropteridine diphosphokinase [Terriglobales bacterium]